MNPGTALRVSSRRAPLIKCRVCCSEVFDCSWRSARCLVVAVGVAFRGRFLACVRLGWCLSLVVVFVFWGSGASASPGVAVGFIVDSSNLLEVVLIQWESQEPNSGSYLQFRCLKSPLIIGVAAEIKAGDLDPCEQERRLRLLSKARTGCSCFLHI